ncbi:hypothetical protein ACHAQG_008258 [Verticillium nonalfalfae]
MSLPDDDIESGTFQSTLLMAYDLESRTQVVPEVPDHSSTDFRVVGELTAYVSELSVYLFQLV